MPTNKQLRILLIEDSEDILFILKTELEWMGYIVDIAKDGADGLKLAKSRHPDVIISDIHMPGMDGIEFIRQVRSIPELASVPAIALTGLDIEEGGNQVLEFGFNAQLTKPAEPAAISALVQKVVAKKTRTRGQIDR